MATVGRSEAGHDHAARAHSDVDHSIQQRWQEVCQSRLLHPVGEVLAITTTHEQDVGLLEERNPTLFLNAWQGSEFQHAERLPAQIAERLTDCSADHFGCDFSTVWEGIFTGEGVYRGRDEKRTRLRDRLAKPVDQCIADASVADASRSEKEFHNSS